MRGVGGRIFFAKVVDDDVHAAAGVTVVGGGNEATQKWSRGKTLKGASTLIGCLLVHLTLGAFYTYGELRQQVACLQNC